MRLGYISAATCALAMLGALGSEGQALASVEKYCTTSWRQAGIECQDWDDCTQQVIAELLERIDGDGLVAAMSKNDSDQRRELNRAIWRTAKRWQRRSRVAFSSDAEVADAREARGREAAESREWIEERLDQLSGLQQEIVRDALDGYSIPETAERLQTTAQRVSDNKYKAIQKLRSIAS
ncbi:MAG: sigma-70 family RNA polymerase sigma factor [Planctomycetales bacterium]|nr:sigma-70 family RNA polymerase sigma factor [Planctomycetales bacterium]